MYKFYDSRRIPPGEFPLIKSPLVSPPLVNSPRLIPPVEFLTLTLTLIHQGEINLRGIDRGEGEFDRGGGLAGGNSLHPKLYYLNLRLLNVLGIWFLKICYGKFCFVSYLVNNRTLSK